MRPYRLFWSLLTASAALALLVAVVFVPAGRSGPKAPRGPARATLPGGAAHRTRTGSTVRARAFAGNQRSFVSAAGNDANTCGPTTPCRTFANAISKTASSGEVVAVDTAGYGSFVVDRALTVMAAPGVQAFVAAPAGVAIEVNPGPTATVVLQNLVVKNTGAASSGVQYESGDKLDIDRLTVTGFGIGIDAVPVSDVGAHQLAVTNTTLRRNSTGLSEAGVDPAPTLFVNIDHTRALDSGNIGIASAGHVEVTISDSVIDGNTTGVSGESEALIVVSRTEIAHNFMGVQTLHIPTRGVRLSDSTITGNTIGVNGPLIASRGNNTLLENTSDGTFSSTFAAR
ncbi:MAG: hypothetical protein QOH95_161 [Gaiellaceae bacterium]|jgi:hypothetical protein|nr:hypothetical protein [Gaiellaceae bacterium]